MLILTADLNAATQNDHTLKKSRSTSSSIEHKMSKKEAFEQRIISPETKKAFQLIAAWVKNETSLEEIYTIPKNRKKKHSCHLENSEGERPFGMFAADQHLTFYFRPASQQRETFRIHNVRTRFPDACETSEPTQVKIYIRTHQDAASLIQLLKTAGNAICVDAKPIDRHTAINVVDSWQHIRRNLIELEKYRTSTDPSTRHFCKDILLNGICFVAWHIGNQTLFGPSRFLGYTNNSLHTHEVNESKHGTETNYAIERVLNRAFKSNHDVDQQYLSFCKNVLHGKPSKKKRRFIVIDETESSKEEETIRDIAVIRTDTSITATTRETLVSARIGQGQFRIDVISIWKRCCVTGCGYLSMLRASHIKPWSQSTNEERLDPYNGLLLVPNLDLAFDRGLISFDCDGGIMVSQLLPESDRHAMGINSSICLQLMDQNKPYMDHHRSNIFLGT